MLSVQEGAFVGWKCLGLKREEVTADGPAVEAATLNAKSGYN